MLDSRDLAERRIETLRRVFRFLGVDGSWVPPSAGREFLRSVDRRMPSPLARAARSVPGLPRIARALPRPARRLAHRLAPRVDLGRATIPTDLRRRLEDELRPDVARLRRFLPEGFDGWGIA